MNHQTSTEATTERAQYERDGFFVVRQVLTSEQLVELQRAAEDAVKNRIGPILFEADEDASDKVPPLYRDESGRVFRRLNRVLDRGGVWQSLIEGPLARTAARLIDGEFQVCLNRHNMLLLKAPYNPAPVLWHQDAAVWDEGRFDHLSAIVALDDFQSDNGPLQVVPGSHRLGPVALGWNDNTQTIQRQHQPLIEREAVIVDLKAGDAVFFHGLLLHGSEGNPSGATRRTLTLAFYPGDLPAVSSATGEQAPQVRAIER